MECYWKLIALCVLAIIISANAGDKKIPKQMRQLYKLYKQNRVKEGDINTIRYIPAHQGSITSPSNLLFSLDSLSKYNETVARAELHFYRRSTEEMKLIQIDVSEVSPYYISLVQRQRLSPTGKGWQQMDITTSIKRCTNTINSNNQLGLGFSDVNADMVAVPVKIPQFLRHHGLPFILVYSNNTRTLEMDQITDKTTVSSAEELLNELDTLVDSKNGKLTGNQKPVYIERRRRSVADNKIDVVETIGDKPWINPDDLYNELTNNIEVKPAGAKSLLEQTTVVKSVQETTEKVQYIPWPTRNKRKKINYKRKNGLVLPTSDFPFTHQQIKSCDRKSLRINFEDIGWGDRIIEPKKFDAYYCAGECKFPYSYGKQLTNHATLQSLITLVRSRTDVPQPCCVPQKLQPVTLMFYDEYKNIVLKTYPDMVVESCACR